MAAHLSTRRRGSALSWPRLANSRVTETQEARPFGESCPSYRNAGLRDNLPKGHRGRPGEGQQSAETGIRMISRCAPAARCADVAPGTRLLPHRRRCPRAAARFRAQKRSPRQEDIDARLAGTLICVYRHTEAPEIARAHHERPWWVGRVGDPVKEAPECPQACPRRKGPNGAIAELWVPQ